MSSPNGKEENVSLKLNSEKSDDKQDNSYLANKVYILEKKVEELNNELKKSKRDIETLFNEIKELKGNKVVNNETRGIKNEFRGVKNNKIFNNTNNSHNTHNIHNTNNFYSNIVNYDKIGFIINHLQYSSIFRNRVIHFNLLYRGIRDGDNTLLLHRECDKHKNVIIFLETEQGNRYGGFSHIGWESREVNKWEYPVDDNAFLFSIDKQKVFQAAQGKNKICWVNEDYGLGFYNTLIFYNNFLTKENYNFGTEFGINFYNCSKSDFNSGVEVFKFSELEVFEIY